MRNHYQSIPDRSRPGLPTTTAGVAQQGTCGNYATAKHSENKIRKRGGRRVKKQREVWKGRRSFIRVDTLNIGTMTGRGRELADMMERRNVDRLCLQDKEGSMVVDFGKRMDLAIVNTYFKKKNEHRVTYKSGGKSTQVYYVMCRRRNLKEMCNSKVIVNECVAKQHRMVVCKMALMVKKEKSEKVKPKIRQ